MKRSGFAYRLDRYADRAATGKIVVGKWVRRAAERHIRDRDGGKARGLRWKPELVERVGKFFGLLRHSKGRAWAGKPFALEDWQVFGLGSMFGWVRDDGRRRYRTAYWEICRKNGKSTIAAGAGLYLLACDHEPGAEVYALATKRDQARIVWTEAERMVRASPDFRKACRFRHNHLAFPRTNSFFAPLGRDKDGLDGLNPHGAIIDEMHAIRDRELVEVIDTATGARFQPLLFQITTAGARRWGICFEQREYSEKLLDGLIEDDSLFPFIASIDADDDWRDEACWPKANPNLGVSCSLEEMRTLAKSAVEVPAKAATFQRYKCGRWIETDNRAILPEVWAAGKLDFDAADLAGRPCYAGVDLSNVRDLTSVTLAFPGDDGTLRVLSRSWIPEASAWERTRRDRAPYVAWMDSGAIVPVPGDSMQFSYPKAFLREVRQRYDLRAVGVDPWNASQLAQDLDAEGFDVVRVHQGKRWMSSPAHELERLLLARQLHHNGDPVLAWAASNLCYKVDGEGNRQPSKALSTERIDPIVALLIALAVCFEKGNDADSIYAHRDLSVVDLDDVGETSLEDFERWDDAKF